MQLMGLNFDDDQNGVEGVFYYYSISRLLLPSP